MSQEWLAPVQAALDSADTPVHWFCRDDDVGWNDAALWPLADVIGDTGARLDLAVIPTALDAPLADALNHLVDHSQSHLRLHQHGYSHANHQAQGRKLEFGSARDAASKYADIAAGRRRLRDLLGPRVDPVFTPPWNRCDQQTVQALQEQGFRALSRDVGAEPLRLQDLVEVPVSIDWCKHHDGTSAARGRLATLIAAQIRLGETLGLMFHHAVMTEPDLQALAELLRLISASRRTRWHHILWIADDIAAH